MIVRFGADGVECLEIMWKLLNHDFEGKKFFQRDSPNNLNRKVAIRLIRSLETARKEDSEIYEKVVHLL